MLYIAADHAGFELKETVKDFLRLEQIPFEDIGPKTLEPDDDYSTIARPVADKVADDATGDSRGILFCGSGIGVCIVANKHKNIRAGTGYNLAAAEMMRADEDANILCLAGRVLQPNFAKAIVRKFLETKFSGEERHVRRIKELTDYDYS